MLQQSSLVGKYPLLFLLLILGSSNLYAQFDSLMLLDSGYYLNESVIYMGDQNDDGCDDFIICKMDSRFDNWGYAYFFYGGNPVPDAPAFRIRIYHPLLITSCDLNKDGYRDIVNLKGGFPQDVYHYDIYYGGPDLDTIPDAVFTLPDSTNAVYFMGRMWPIDFDGDGWEELVYVTTNSHKVWFIRNYEANQPLEYYSIPRIGNMYYSESLIFSSDLDGDGKSDLTVCAADPDGLRLLRFYYGNSSYDLSHYYEFSSDTINHLDELYLLNDMNGDGKGEICMLLSIAGSGKYGLSFGSKPPDLQPDLLMNAGGIGGGRGFSPGDVNGDGFGDFVKYVPFIRNALYLGGSTITGQAAQQYFSNYWLNSMHFGGRVGDINGDGLADICVGETAGTAVLSHIYIYAGTRTPVSVEEEADSKRRPNELALSVSPNPTNGVVAVNCSLPVSGDLMIEVFNILGERIYSSSSPREKGAVSEKIDLTHRAGTSGVYIFRTTLTTPGKTYSKSLKVQVVR